MFIIAAKFVGTMNERTYPGNLSWPRNVAGVLLVLTSILLIILLLVIIIY